MKNKLIQQFLASEEMTRHRECLSKCDKELYNKFLLARNDFKKELKKQVDKELTYEISEAIDRIIKTFMDCFFELAYSYYDVGNREGLISAAKYLKSK